MRMKNRACSNLAARPNRSELMADRSELRANRSELTAGRSVPMATGAS